VKEGRKEREGKEEERRRKVKEGRNEKKEREEGREKGRHIGGSGGVIKEGH
jgi:hypothetical protein